MKYEVEFKVELSEEEAQNVKRTFITRGFKAAGIDQQNDYYIEAKRSSVCKGYDLKRYRDQSGKIIYTEKIWEVAGDTPARKEIERETTQDEFTSTISKYPNAIKISKQREWFIGNFKELQHINITIDRVKFDHSPSVRFFIEAETLTEDINKVRELKELFIDFLKSNLGKVKFVESPGIFSMAFKKK